MSKVQKEIWKDIAGYENYRISTLGRVFSKDRHIPCGLSNTTHTFRRGRFLKFKTTKFGYIRVELARDATRKIFLLHRLVGFAFLPNPNNYPQINHIDGDKSNNNISNLEWCTARQNLIHALNTGLRVTPKEFDRRLLKPNNVKFIKANEKTIKTSIMARKFGVTSGTIRNVIRNKTYTK